MKNDFGVVFTMQAQLVHEKTLFHLEPSEVCFEGMLRAVAINDVNFGIHVPLAYHLHKGRRPSAACAKGGGSNYYVFG